MKTDKWVVAVNVSKSAAARRTDSSGDMEQLELLELILVSEHDTKSAALKDAALRRARKDGWRYVVMSRRDYDSKSRPTTPRAA
jgi:hypothetical protein